MDPYALVNLIGFRCTNAWRCCQFYHKVRDFKIKRTNKLFEPMQYSFFHRSGLQCHSYSVDSAAAQIYPRALVKINNISHVFNCHDCVVNDKLKLTECAIDGCNNKDETKICANHLCCICSNSKYGYTELRKCDSCGQGYCGSKDGNILNSCGSVYWNECSKCFKYREENDLLNAIVDSGLFYGVVANILYEYAKGFLVACGNCARQTFFDSRLDFERTRYIYKLYKVEKTNPMQCVVGYNNKRYLGGRVIKIYGNYYRVLCKECGHLYDKLERCRKTK